MARRVFTVLCLGVLCALLANCGQTYELQSIAVTPTYVDLYKTGASQTFTVTATYTNTKTSVVTAKAQYTLANSSLSSAPVAALALTNNGTGYFQVLGNPACTFTATLASSGSGYVYQDYPYTLNISYTEGSITKTAVASIDVNNEADCYDGTNTTHP